MPEDSRDEFFRLSFVVLSVVVGAITCSGAFARSFGHHVSGGFFFYSVVLGAVLLTIAAAAIAGKKVVGKPRGIGKTQSIGLFAGLVILSLVDLTVFLGVVPRF